MTKYEPITFTKLSEAIAYVEEGGELYVTTQILLEDGYTLNVELISCLDLPEMWIRGKDTFLTKPKPAPWYEKLDGTIENGVLCWVDDGGDLEDKNVDLVIGFDDSKRYDAYKALTCTWTCATPLTRTEIQKLMDNAPEEV